jgi:hypothetical protein
MSEDIGLKAWVRVSADILQSLALLDPHRCSAQGVQGQHGVRRSLRVAASIRSQNQNRLRAPNRAYPSRAWPSSVRLRKPRARLQVQRRDQVVDELIIYFTHDCPIDYMLPGIPRTGRKVALPHVVVMKFKGDNSPTSISTGIKLVCSLRSVFSTQANCPSPEPSKPRHSLKNRGGSERKRDRPEPSDLPIQAGAALFRANTGHTVAIFRQIRQRRASRQS